MVQHHLISKLQQSVSNNFSFPPTLAASEDCPSNVVIHFFSYHIVYTFKNIDIREAVKKKFFYGQAQPSPPAPYCQDVVIFSK